MRDLKKFKPIGEGLDGTKGLSRVGSRGSGKEVTVTGQYGEICLIHGECG